MITICVRLKKFVRWSSGAYHSVINKRSQKVKDSTLSPALPPPQLSCFVQDRNDLLPAAAVLDSVLYREVLGRMGCYLASASPCTPPMPLNEPEIFDMISHWDEPECQEVGVTTI